jgi:hypothetical protein
MRKTVATVVTLVLVWIGYTAWPLYDLLVLVHAMETRDVGTVTRHVYFDAVRASLTQQVVAAYVRRTKINISPFAQSMAAGTLGIANPIVQKLISPEALCELIGIGWPVTVGSDPPPGTVGITERTIRSGGAIRAAAAATLPSYVSATAVALASGRCHPAREYSEPARG